MEVVKIGYGRASVHDFESSDYREYCYMEATIESWENPEQSLQLLRRKVCEEVGVSENIQALQLQRRSLEEENRQLEAAVVELRKKWHNLKELHEKISEIEVLKKGFDPTPF